jgi:DNA polymerase III sliding clamp (beta) subunit (PCNA family)
MANPISKAFDSVTKFLTNAAVAKADKAVRFDVEPDKTTITARSTNVEFSVEVEGDYRVGSEGYDFTIPGRDFKLLKTLLSAAGENPRFMIGSQIHVYDDMGSKIGSVDSVANIEPMLADTLEYTGKFVVGGFLHHVGAVKYAASCKDIGRKHLEVIHFEAKSPSEMLFTATDGHRMAHSSLHTDSDIVPEALVGLSWNIPVAGIGSVPYDKKAHTAVYTRDGIFTLIHGYYKVVSVCETRFPDYRQVVPKESGSFQVDRKGLLNALSRFKGVPTGKPIRMTVERGFHVDTLLLHYKEFDGGKEVNGYVPISEGEFEVTTPIGINPKYLVEALKNMTDETVDIQCGDGLSPIMLTTSHGWHLIMPMRV